MMQVNSLSRVSELLNQRSVSYNHNTISQENNYYQNDNFNFNRKNSISSDPFSRVSNELSEIYNKVKNSVVSNLSGVIKYGESLVYDNSNIVSTRFKDAQGRNIKVRNDVVQPLNNLINITSQKGIKVQVSSSYRSVEHQKELWNKALKKYGSVKTARKWVAPPGKSNHNRGVALDLSMYRNGKKLSQREFDNIIAQAGFYRPMSWEGWHIEPLSTKKTRGLA
ncbi:MAG: M15 family metallopeptidase [Candidatus Sericytochromatia bacterium]